MTSDRFIRDYGPPGPHPPLTTRHLPITAHQRERWAALPDGWFTRRDVPWLEATPYYRAVTGLYAKRWLERRRDPKNAARWEWVKV